MNPPEQKETGKTLIEKGPAWWAGGCLLLLLGCAGLPFYVVEGHPVSIRNLAKVEIGMTKAEVQSILGSPTDEDKKSWRYHGMTWCIVYVWFDDGGRVTVVEHDH